MTKLPRVAKFFLPKKYRNFSKCLEKRARRFGTLPAFPIIYKLAIHLDFTEASKMSEDRTKDWQELCRMVATELDPAKLMHLIAELTKALDERKNKRGSIREQPDDKDPREGSLQSAF